MKGSTRMLSARRTAVCVVAMLSMAAIAPSLAAGTRTAAQPTKLAKKRGGKKTEPVARFRVTVHGKQQTTWRDDSDDPYGLGSCHGGGSEVVTFSTPAPVKMVAGYSGSSHKGVSHTFNFKHPAEPPSFWATANVQRSISYTQASPDLDCGPQGPDISGVTSCARSGQLQWQLEAPITLAKANAIVLVSAGSSASHAPEPDDPFPDCPQYGNPFPSLLENGNRSTQELLYGDYVAAPLSTKKLLYSKRKRFTTSAHGLYVDDTSSQFSSASTEVSWTMTLTRIGKKKKR